MATVIKGRHLAQLLQQQAVLRTDQVMSEKSMQAYLRYKLVIVEGDIRQIIREMRDPAAPQPDPVHGWNGGYAGAAFAHSWTSLNYLLNARDSLKMTLADYDQE